MVSRSSTVLVQCCLTLVLDWEQVNPTRHSNCFIFLKIAQAGGEPGSFSLFSLQSSALDHSTTAPPPAVLFSSTSIL